MASQEPSSKDPERSTASPAAEPVGEAAPGNAMRRAGARSRRPEAAPSGKTPDGARTEASDANSIRPSRRVRREPAAPRAARGAPEGGQAMPEPPRAAAAEEAKSPSAHPPPPPQAADAVPEAIRARFVQVGRTYYFPDGARAFTDRGTRLTTPSENTEVVRSLVAIAQARGWSEIVVSGSERFRKEAWAAAQRAGLATRGYAPSALARAQLERKRSGREAQEARDEAGEPEAPESRRAGDAPRRASERTGALLRGRLLEHGRAPYRHDPHEPMSYFVKLETARGERTIWGVDLERAMRESLSQPRVGDEVGLRTLKREAVTVKTQTLDREGRATGERELATHRNRWSIETREFLEGRAQAARALRDPALEPRRAVEHHPELAGTYLQLRGAEEIARRRIRDPEDQRRFVALVREALAGAIARGEPLAPVRLRERAAREARAAEREPGLAR